MFPAPQGGHVRLDLWRRRTWAPGVKAAGLAHLRPHDLRHTAVALWIAAGASPKEIAARAGHTSVVTVLDRYGHLLPGHEEKVNDALDEMARVARPRLRVVPDKAPSEDMSRENPEIPRDVRAMNHSGRESAASEKAADQVVHEWAMGTRTPDLCRAKNRQTDPSTRRSGRPDSPLLDHPIDSTRQTRSCCLREAELGKQVTEVGLVGGADQHGARPDRERSSRLRVAVSQKLDFEPRHARLLDDSFALDQRRSEFNPHHVRHAATIPRVWRRRTRPCLSRPRTVRVGRSSPVRAGQGVAASAWLGGIRRDPQRSRLIRD